MKRYLFILCFSFTVLWCNLSIAQKPDVIFRDLSNLGNNKISSTELLHIKKNSDSNLMVLSPPDTTKMAHSRKAFLLKRNDSINTSIATDTISNREILNRWRRVRYVK